MPNGVFSARPPANATAPWVASVWQPTQPPAFARYSPRFASPWAKALSKSARKRTAKSKSPAAAGRVRDINGLLLLAELLVAGAAGFAGRADLRLYRGLVAALADLGKLRCFALEVLGRFLELVGLFPDRGKRRALHALGVRIEAVPGHLAQGFEKARVALNHGSVIGDLALRHAAHRAHVLALQGHRRLALLYQGLRLGLRGGVERKGGADRHRKGNCDELELHYFLLWGKPSKVNRQSGRLFRLSQSGRVFRHGADFALAQPGGDAAHHAVRIVGPRAVAESLELGRYVVGVLAGKARVLRWDAGAGGPVTAAARRHAGGQVAAPPELLAERRELLVRGGGGLELLAGEVGREALHVGIGKVRHPSTHDRVLARRLLPGLRLEIGELLMQILGELPCDLRVRGGSAVAVRRVAGGANLSRDALPLAGIGFRVFLCKGRSCGQNQQAGGERQGAKHS